jgi:pterin-4a-carbinolamine dehydratase
MELEEIKLALGPDTKWDAFESSLSRNFSFLNNNEAHIFLGKVDEISTRYENRTDMFVHSYNNVKVMLTTDEVGDVTPVDIEISREIDKVYEDIVSARR